MHRDASIEIIELWLLVPQAYLPAPLMQTASKRSGTLLSIGLAPIGAVGTMRSDWRGP
jgi:hypothetical protein